MPSQAIIFIPGIKGTKLVDTNRVNFDTVWSGIQSNFDEIENLELIRGDDDWYYDKDIRTIIKAGEIEELAYREFLRDLNSDKPIYIFNYDWRQSASVNGALLVDFVNELIEKSAASQRRAFESFDFITHSLGNFVLRNYILREGFSHINRIVFTVPPFRGSLKIVSTAILGEGLFPGVKAKIRKLIRTFPGALELLPSYTGATGFDDRQSPRHNLFNFSHWQHNMTNPANSVSEAFEQALQTARGTVRNGLADLSQLSNAERRRILILCRTGYDTFQSLRVLRNDPNQLFDLEDIVETEDGDGSVPHISSCCYAPGVRTLAVQDSKFYREYDHGFFLKDERVQKLIKGFLFGSSPFSNNIPGKSVKRVTGLRRGLGNNRLPYWEAEYED